MLKTGFMLSSRHHKTVFYLLIFKRDRNVASLFFLIVLGKIFFLCRMLSLQNVAHSQ